MKHFFKKTFFAILSVILFYGCSQEPYDWSEGKTVINNAETSFPLIQNEAIQIKSYFNTKGGSFKVEHSLCINKGNKWEVIETKEATPVNGENGYFVSEFSNLQGNTEYQIIISVYNLKDVEKPIYQEKLNVKTAIDEYSIASGDAKEVTQTTATIITEFSSEKLKPKENELGIVYSTNENDIKSNKSIFVPYSSNTDIVYFTNLSELQPATTYYYCACIIINGQRAYAEEIRSFQTKEIEITEEDIVDLGLEVKWTSHNWKNKNGSEYITWPDYAEYSSIKPEINNLSGSGYDIVTKTNGNNWRIPDKKDWDELIKSCKCEWVTYRGENGIKLTGPNGNSIFLPAMGYLTNIHDTEITNESYSGYYWCGSGGNGESYKYIGYFRSGKFTLDITSPFKSCCTIRPVIDKFEVTQSMGEVVDLNLNSVKIKTKSPVINSENIVIQEKGIWYSETEIPCIDTGLTNIGSESDDDSYICEIKDLKFSTTYYFCPYVKINDRYYFGDTNKFTTKDEISKDKIVDLGLTSETKWSGYNWGSTSPEEAGTLIKYSELNINVTDRLHISETENDFVFQKDKELRIPTSAEITELTSNCQWTYQQYNNVYGYKITGPNGNSIFMPFITEMNNIEFSSGIEYMSDYFIMSDGNDSFSNYCLSLKRKNTIYLLHGSFLVRPVSTETNPLIY